MMVRKQAQHIRKVNTKRGKRRVVVNPGRRKKVVRKRMVSNIKFDNNNIYKDGVKVGSYSVRDVRSKDDSYPLITILDIDKEHQKQGIGQEFIKQMRDIHADNLAAIARKDSLGFWKKVGGKVGPRMPVRDEEYFIDFKEDE